MQKRFWGINRRPTLVVLFICALVAFTAFGFVNNKKNLANTRAVDTQSPLTVIGVVADDHVISGTIGAPVQMIIYSDLDCPYCKSMYLKTLPRIESEFGDKIVIAFRAPFATLNPLADRSSLAVRLVDCSTA